uniref:Uncharacterized protein n=1 Tax=Gasterosteus aculeatus TaxID=69293 RepID=G3Q5I3_GASAC
MGLIQEPHNRSSLIQLTVCRSVGSFWPWRSRARSHRCTTAALRRTTSLSNHFAPLPRIHWGPVSVLAGCSARFILVLLAHIFFHLGQR